MSSLNRWVDHVAKSQREGIERVQRGEKDGRGGWAGKLILNKCFVHEPFIECLFFYFTNVFWLIVFLTQTSM